MNIIIVGCGKIGKSLVESLVSEGHDVAVVDKNEARCAEFTESLPGATLLLSFAMLLGRLEVFPLLLGLNPLIWKKQK